MGAFVTADPDTRIIQLTRTPVNGIVTLDVVADIYSELKRDWHSTPALQKVRFCFDDSIGPSKNPTQQVGPYVTLRNGDGWRIRPLAADHELILNGNLLAADVAVPRYTLPAGFSISILEEQSAQALTTVANVESLQSSSFFAEVAINTTAGDSLGTQTVVEAYPLGTREMPVDNFADAATIAQERGINTLRLVDQSAQTVIGAGASIAGYLVLGESSVTVSVDVQAAADVVNCTFRDLTIEGTLDGDNILERCLVDDVNFFNGLILTSALGGTVTLGGGIKALILDSYSSIPGGGSGATCIIDGGGSGQELAMRRWSGGVTLQNFTGADSHSIDLDGGRVVLDPTVTSGTFTFRGIGDVEDTSGNAILSGTWNGGVTIVNGTNGAQISAAFDAAEISRAILQNRTITDPVTGIMTVYDEDGVTPLLTAQLYEDAAGVQTYQGQGAERREALS